MSPIGKKKCPYSPLQKRGLINPSPVMNNGDDKKEKGATKTSSSYTTSETGYIPKGEQLKKEQEALNKEAQEKQQELSRTFKGKKRETWNEHWEKNKESLMKKHGSKEGYLKWAKEWSENNPNEITITAGYTKNEPKETKNQIQKKAKPVYDNITDYLRGTGVKLPFDTYKTVATEKSAYPGGPMYDSYEKVPLNEEEMIEALKNNKMSEHVAQYRNATKNKDIEGGTTTVIGKDGDPQELNNYVNQNLDLNAAALTNINNEETTVKSSGESN